MATSETKILAQELDSWTLEDLERPASPVVDQPTDNQLNHIVLVSQPTNHC